MNLFDEQKLFFKTDYCWMVLLPNVPFIANYNHLEKIFEKINVFWEKTAKIIVDRKDPYYCFTISQVN